MDSHIYSIILNAAKTDPQFQNLCDTDILRTVFANSRTSNMHGIRLSFAGHQLLSKLFTCYVYSFDEIAIIPNRVYLALDKHMRWPYYVSSRRIVFYSEVDAAMYSISGDLITFAETL